MKKLNTILIAPDSFKGAMSSKKICDVIEQGILKESPGTKVIKVPMADGGEGTVESLVLNTSGKYVDVTVTGPLGNKVTARYGVLGDDKTAVIEMAEASGLSLVPLGKRNPMVTTTFGTGELVKDAILKGCTKIILGIGGSATNDCGAGAMQALGFSLLDSNGQEISFGGQELKRVVKIDTTNRLKELDGVDFLIACDVDNPLLGERGATYTYGPQKGATDQTLPILEDAISHFNTIIESDLRILVKDIPGAGAAGGLGAGLVGFLNGKLTSGINLVTDHIEFKNHFIKNSIDLVITGEGAMDYQTAYGKLPVGVAKIAKDYNVSVVAMVGTMGKGAEDILEKGVDSIVSIVDGPITLEEAMKNTERLLYKKTRMVIRLIQIGLK